MRTLLTTLGSWTPPSTHDKAATSHVRCVPGKWFTFLMLAWYLVSGTSSLVAQVVKAFAYNAGDPSSVPGSGRSLGGGNGDPLQYSCLENFMDGGAWWATVDGVAKSRSRLSDFTFTFTAFPSWGCLLVPQCLREPSSFLPCTGET